MPLVPLEPARAGFGMKKLTGRPAAIRLASYPAPVPIPLFRPEESVPMKPSTLGLYWFSLLYQVELLNWLTAAYCAGSAFPPEALVLPSGIPFR